MRESITRMRTGETRDQRDGDTLRLLVVVRTWAGTRSGMAATEEFKRGLSNLLFGA
jgi:hypothetical protein